MVPLGLFSLVGGLDIFGHLLDFLDVGLMERLLRRYFLLASYVNFGAVQRLRRVYPFPAGCLQINNRLMPAIFAVSNTYLVLSVRYTLCYLDIALAQWHQVFFGPIYKEFRLD